MLSVAKYYKCYSRTGVKRRREPGGGVQRPMTLSGDAPLLTSE